MPKSESFSLEDDAVFTLPYLRFLRDQIKERKKFVAGPGLAVLTETEEEMCVGTSQGNTGGTKTPNEPQEIDQTAPMD